MQIFDMIKTMTTVESVRELAERFKKKRAPLARHSVSRVPLPDISNDEAYKQIQQQIGNIPPEAL
jgi:NifB/MoaA-like Fe-S oxidoreductase